MYIPLEILNALKKKPDLTANQIAYKFDKSKSSAYRYIQIFKKVDHTNGYTINQLTTFHKKVIDNHSFDNFIFKTLKTGGFKSTKELYEKFKLEFPLSNHLSRRTFNKLFASTRARQKIALKKRVLRISRSKNKPLIGFFTVKRRCKLQDYEE